MWRHGQGDVAAVEAGAIAGQAECVFETASSSTDRHRDTGRPGRRYPGHQLAFVHAGTDPDSTAGQGFHVCFGHSAILGNPGGLGDLGDLGQPGNLATLQELSTHADVRTVMIYIDDAGRNERVAAMTDDLGRVMASVPDHLRRRSTD